jgi:hypothetical protein
MEGGAPSPPDCWCENLRQTKWPEPRFAYQPHCILSDVGAIVASAARRFPCKELNCRERQISCKKPLAVWAEVCMIKR